VFSSLLCNRLSNEEESLFVVALIILINSVPVPVPGISRVSDRENGLQFVVTGTVPRGCRTACQFPYISSFENGACYYS
jgi:hypothetical protein